MNHRGPIGAATRLARFAGATISAWALSSSAGAVGIGVDGVLLDANPGGEHWAGYGRTFDEQRFSPLTQLHEGNIDRVTLAWSLELPDVHSVTTVPIAADGVIFFAAGYSVIHAVDARNGKLLWRYDPEVAKASASKMRMAWGSRGLALWKGRIYAGTQDGRLIALDASTGKLLWSVLTIEQGDPYRYITGAPRVFDDKVIIGHGGADFGPVRGYVTAYDAHDGQPIWRFHTVPGDPREPFENPAMEMAARTWTGEWWRFGGGGTAWNAMTYDPEFDRVYIGTGNGSPWNRKIRSPGGGDNLFLSSVVALDADTGDYVWHYQTTPGETWDYNSAMDMVLVTLPIDGRTRKLMLHAPKNGFFYVLDRETGRLVSAEKIAKVSWADRIDTVSGRPVENTEARYPDGEAVVWPSGVGAHNWHPMAFSPLTKLAYVPVVERSGYYNDMGIDPARWQHPPRAAFSPGLAAGAQRSDQAAPVDAWLLAWDPIRQRKAWRVRTASGYSGGVSVTAGNLLLQGGADGKLSVFTADSGKLLRSFELGVGTLSPPITYLVDGKQHISILAGWSRGLPLAPNAADERGWWIGREQPRRLLSFTLDGTARLPDSVGRVRVTPLAEPGFTERPALVTQGAVIYGQCVMCHGHAAVSGGFAPDLRASSVVLSPQAFAATVRDGTLAPRGMPAFPELGPEALDALRHYIRSRAHAALERPSDTNQHKATIKGAQTPP